MTGNIYQPDFERTTTHVRRFAVAFVRIFEGIGRVVLARTLVNVQRLQIHRHRHGAFELEFRAQRVPAEEWRRIRRDPLLDETIAVEKRTGPIAVP